MKSQSLKYYRKALFLMLLLGISFFLFIPGSSSVALGRAVERTALLVLDSYEPDNSPAQAKQMFTGSSQTRSISPATDVDWVKFTLAGIPGATVGAVAIETTGPIGYDTRIWLYDSNLTEIRFSDDEGAGLYSYINTCDMAHLPVGTYYIKVDGFNKNNEIPSYTLSISVGNHCVSAAVASLLLKSYPLFPGTMTRQSFVSANYGPVHVFSDDATAILAAQRVIWKEPGFRSSYSEMMGLPKWQLSNEYWFPWYNNAAVNSMDQGFRIANVDLATANIVEVWVGNTLLQSITLGPGASIRVGYNVDNGPIRILCTTCTNAISDRIVASLRVIWKEPGFRSSYSEMMGLPKEQLSSEYWFPWYNNAAVNSMDQGFRIANVDLASPNTVEVWVGTTLLDTLTLGAGRSIRVGYNVDNGPVRVVCTTCSNTGNDKIIAALRVIWKEPGYRSSYSEMMGLPKEQLSSEYWFPWYNNAAINSMDQGFRIANVDTFASNNVEIWVGTTLLETIKLAAGGSIRVGYNVDNGPIRIVCTTCTNTGNDKVIAALRVIWKEPGFRSSYSEMMGLPVEQLAEEYWFPWYNNFDMDGSLRFGPIP